MTVLTTPEPARVPPADAHEHDWRLVQVDYVDGCSVREFACGGCSAAWFA